MSQYRIEKDRVPVVVSMVSGRRISGEMFVQPYARHRGGPEEPQDVLNAAEPFFPLAEPSGEVRLVAKDLVAEVEALLPAGEDPVRHAGMQPAVIEVRLSTGAQRSGAIFLELPTSRPRLLDYLNRVGERFLLLHDGDHLRLLNRRHIESVRPLD